MPLANALGWWSNRFEKEPIIAMRRHCNTVAVALLSPLESEHGLLVTSSHGSADGLAGDQTLLAPAFVASDAELDEMVQRFAATVADVEASIKRALSGAAA